MAQPVIYVRRSYKEATAADVSDEMQEAACRRLLPPGAAARVISDSGGHQSGFSAARDGYQALLAALAAGEVSALLVYDLSRLARNARLMLDLSSRARAPPGAAPRRQHAGRQLRWRQRPLHVRPAGLGGPAPARSRLGADDRHPAPSVRGRPPPWPRPARLRQPARCQSATSATRASSRWYPRRRRSSGECGRELADHSLAEVADLLNRDGVAHHGPWTREAVKDIWRRGRFYLGYVVEKRGRDERPGRHEPILDEAAVRTDDGRGRGPDGGSATSPSRSGRMPSGGCSSAPAAPASEARPTSSAGRRSATTAARPSAARPGAARPRRSRPRSWRSIGTAALPRLVVDAARAELRKRLQTPDVVDVGRQRARLTKRLEQLKKQNGWGDLPDAEYLVQRDAAKAPWPPCPTTTGSARSTLTGRGSSSCPKQSRRHHRPGGRSYAGSSSSGSSSATADSTRSPGHRRSARSSKNSGSAPKGIRTPDLHLERVAS